MNDSSDGGRDEEKQTDSSTTIILVNEIDCKEKGMCNGRLLDLDPNKGEDAIYRDGEDWAEVSLIKLSIKTAFLNVLNLLLPIRKPVRNSKLEVEHMNLARV